MEDFEREKNVVWKGKILRTYQYFKKIFRKNLMDTHAKKFTEYLCIFFFYNILGIFNYKL